MSSPDTIIQRLEALKIWQETEQQKLLEQQIAQRKLFVSEQQRMYDALGLSYSTENSSIPNDQIQSDTSSCSKSSNDTDNSSCSSEDKILEYDLMDGISVIEDTIDTEDTADSENCKPKASENITQNMCKKNEQLEDIMSEQYSCPRVKKQFLRRGTGLIKYKMKLDDCKLKNIPKYKFSKPKSNGSPMKPSIKETICHEKEQKRSKKIHSNNQTNRECSEPAITKNALSDKKASLQCRETANKNNNQEVTTEIENSKSNMQSCNAKSLQSWAKVLNKEHMIRNFNDSMLSTEINPQQDKIDLKYFELLEQRANNSSFCSTSSIVTKFMGNEPLTEQESFESLKNHPLPSQLRLRQNFTNKELSDTNSTKGSEYSPARQVSGLRVRFDDNIRAQSESDTSETELDSYDDITSLTSSCTSTPNTKPSKSLEENISLENIIQDNSELKNEILTQNQIPILTSNEKKNTTTDKNCITNPAEINIAKDISTKQRDVEANLAEKQQIILQSSLLRKRLQELEKEIELFRKENITLTQNKQAFETQKASFQRRMRQDELKMNEERSQHEIYLAAEKRKLAEDKLIFEKYVTDLKKHPTKKEREEIILLKEKITELQQELRSKDAKSGATNARLRTQIRNLETEIANHKKTIDELKEKNKKLLMANNQYRKASNKRMLQEIQSNLTKISTENLGSKGTTIRNHVQCSTCPVNTEGEPNRENSYIEREENGYYTDKSSDENDHEIVEAISKNIITMIDKETMTENFEILENQALYTERSDYASFKKRHDITNNIPSNVKETIISNYLPSVPYNDQNIPSTCSPFTFDIISTKNQHNLHSNDFRNLQLTQLEPVPSISSTFKKEREEIFHPDGCKEIRYSNGNIKKISPDEKIIKIIFFNGDIKEISKYAGTVKYYYAKNKMWHTSFSDGLEILEFPNGQMERRYKNGTTEVRFPDGSIRSTKISDLSIIDEWRYPDGSVLVNKKNGEKMLCMSNGQREIHTSEHRRREFPDGTVKIVYPDGSQETRYANGRIRTKDSKGNLIKDNHVA